MRMHSPVTSGVLRLPLGIPDEDLRTFTQEMGSEVELRK